MFKFLLVLGVLFSGSAFAGAYSDAISVQGDTIRVTRAAADDIRGDSLLTIVMQAASAPVFDAETDTQEGYELSEIEPSSVFESLGIMNGDVVLEIEGVALVNPKIAVELLRYAKGLDAFEVLIKRDGVKRVLRVVVSG